MNMVRARGLILAVAALALLPASPSIAQSLAHRSFPTTAGAATVTSVRVTASNYNGKCSGDVSFTARIEASGPVTVEYRWVTDDGEQSTPSTLVFEQAGGKTVYMAIQGVVNAGKTSAKGWGALRIVAPNRVESNKAFYSAVCGD